MSKKQTAVEWLFDQIPLDYKLTRSAFDEFRKAKAMEREQIIDAAERWKGTKFAEQYYNETYGGEE